MIILWFPIAAPPLLFLSDSHPLDANLIPATALALRQRSSSSTAVIGPGPHTERLRRASKRRAAAEQQLP